jgi:hypothetical protein
MASAMRLQCMTRLGAGDEGMQMRGGAAAWSVTHPFGASAEQEQSQVQASG